MAPAFRLRQFSLNQPGFGFHNRDPHIANLYFAAAGAHPGAGMPGVLCSAKVVERLIADDERAALAVAQSEIAQAG